MRTAVRKIVTFPVLIFAGMVVASRTIAKDMKVVRAGKQLITARKIVLSRIKMKADREMLAVFCRVVFSVVIIFGLVYRFWEQFCLSLSD